MTSPIPFKLDFIVVGSRKCATTWLYEVFLRHSDICVSETVKESGFFTRNSDRDLAWYRRLFPPCEATAVTGEVAPEVISNPGAVARLAEYFPEVKVICVFRNPADMFFSSHDHAVRMGDTALPAAEAWKKSSFLRDELLYGTMMKRVYAAFPKERVLVLRYEDIDDNAARVLEEIAGFLGIAADFDVDVVTSRQNPSRRARFRLLGVLMSRGSRMARKLHMHALADSVKRWLGGRLFVTNDRDTIRRARSEVSLRTEILVSLAEELGEFSRVTGIDASRWWPEIAPWVDREDSVGSRGGVR